MVSKLTKAVAAEAAIVIVAVSLAAVIPAGAPAISDVSIGWSGENRASDGRPGGKTPVEAPDNASVENRIYENPAGRTGENLRVEVSPGDGESAASYRLAGGKLRGGAASYSVDPANGEGIDPATVVRKVEEAFETWDGRTSRDLFDDAAMVVSGGSFERDGTNTVLFATMKWEEAIAKTGVWYDRETGAILEFDIVLNSNWNFGVKPGEKDEFIIDEYDLRAVLTHEVGHALGLGDLEGDGLSEMTMYMYAAPGSASKASLENGDVAGLHELYGK